VAILPPFSSESGVETRGIRVAAVIAAMRKLTSAFIVACVVVSTAIVSTQQRRHWTEKLDRPLVHSAKQGGAEPVNALIRLRPGATDQFVEHLTEHGLKPTFVAANLVSVQLPASMLRSIALDRDVEHLSLP
jgi:2-phospho-L-lactate transferase/gluconeogenesis factor (CofD/UPF0052 family)